MADIPLPDIIRQVSLQWKQDSAAAEAAVDQACHALGLTPRKRFFGPKSLTGEEYRLVLEWLNRYGIR